MPLILLIDDDADVRASVAEFLQAEGYSVVEAAGRAAALDLLRTTKPDAIILDYALPEPTGGAEFLLAKASVADIASIPVIVTSGFALPSGLPGASSVINVTEPGAKPIFCCRKPANAFASRTESESARARL